MHPVHTSPNRFLQTTAATRRLVVLLSCLLVVIVVLPRPKASADSTTFAPVADSYVRSDKPNTNFGTESLLHTGAKPLMTSYLRFNVGTLGGAITGAVLRVFTITDGHDPISVRQVSDTTWAETTITYANAPPPSSTVLASSPSFKRYTWLSLPVGSVVTGPGEVDLAITSATNGDIAVGAREARSYGPQLVITTAPDSVPPSVPTNVSATASSGRVDVSWTASTDDKGMASYTVYRNGVRLASVTGGATTYGDASVAGSTTYAYTVDAVDVAGNHSAQSTPASATTPATPVPDPVIAAAGDIACDSTSSSYNGGVGTATSCKEMATSNLLLDPLPTAVLALGDEQYECGALAAFQQSYDPTWGRVKSITRPIVGNHEYEQPTTGVGCPGPGDASGYSTYFGAAAGTPGQLYYSYDIGAWHLIALNSECGHVGGCFFGSPEEVWLRTDLLNHPDPCTLAYWHEPMFSSTIAAARSAFQQFWKDLYASGAEIVLNGHDHVYERFAPEDPSAVADPNGIREFIVGTGGRSHIGFSRVAANSEVRNSTAFGVLRLTLHPTSYDWNFVPAAGSTLTDSGSTPCH
jgi:hypothetical protein